MLLRGHCKQANAFAFVRVCVCVWVVCVYVLIKIKYSSTLNLPHHTVIFVLYLSNQDDDDP